MAAPARAQGQPRDEDTRDEDSVLRPISSEVPFYFRQKTPPAFFQDEYLKLLDAAAVLFVARHRRAAQVPASEVLVRDVSHFSGYSRFHSKGVALDFWPNPQGDWAPACVGPRTDV